ncbi:MAG: DJ-1 family glyoxalase III [Candidatus Omnitrophota bacterium]
MAKKAVVILADGFEEIEAVTCVDVLRRASVEVVVAGLGAKHTGSRGLIVTPDTTIDRIEPDFDAVVLPGGMPGATNLAASEPARKLITDTAKKGGIVAAICASPAVVLAPLGILDNKKATCYPGMQQKFGPKTAYTETAVVTDANVITSRGPATAMEFALAIASALADSDTVRKLRQALLCA